MSEFTFVGVDVSKKKLDVTILLKNDRFKYKQFDNNTTGFKSLCEWMAKYGQKLWVCMEATGHYSEHPANYLSEQGIKVITRLS